METEHLHGVRDAPKSLRVASPVGVVLSHELPETLSDLPRRSLSPKPQGDQGVVQPSVDPKAPPEPLEELAHVLPGGPPQVFEVEVVPGHGVGGQGQPTGIRGRGLEGDQPDPKTVHLETPAALALQSAPEAVKVVKEQEVDPEELEVVEPAQGAPAPEDLQQVVLPQALRVFAEDAV